MTTRLPSLHGRLTTFLSGPWDSTDSKPVLDIMAESVDGPVDGLDLTAHLTRDGIVVVADSDRIRTGLRRRRIDQLDAADLPLDVARLSDVLGHTFNRKPLLITVRGAAVFEAVVGTARNFGSEVERHLWLASDDHAQLVTWRPRTDAVLLHATALRRIDNGTEKLLATLHGDDLNGITMPHADWSGGTVALAHRFELLTHASGAEHNRELAEVIDAGIDAVTAADRFRLAAMADQFYP